MIVLHKLYYSICLLFLDKQFSLFNPTMSLANNINPPLYPQLEVVQQSDETQRTNHHHLAIPSTTTRKRKLSNIYERVKSKNHKDQQEKKQEQPTKSTSKFKGERKDTKQTMPTLSDILSEFQQISKDNLTPELVKKSQIDPFLQRKLKKLVEHDLKNVQKVSNTKSLSQSFSAGNIRIGFGGKSAKSPNSNAFAGKDCDKLVKDVSMMLIKNLAPNMNSSMTSNDSVTNINKRVLNDFPESQDSLLNGEHHVQQNYTTFRKQNFKSKIQRLERFKELTEKQQILNQNSYEQQLYTPQYRPNCSNNTFDRCSQNNNLWDQFKKFNIKDSV